MFCWFKIFDLKYKRQMYFICFRIYWNLILHNKEVHCILVRCHKTMIKSRIPTTIPLLIIQFWIPKTTTKWIYTYIYICLNCVVLCVYTVCLHNIFIVQTNMTIPNTETNNNASSNGYNWVSYLYYGIYIFFLN